MKNKKYIFELIIRESESLEKLCSTITACDYSLEELKERKADNEVLFCKDILTDQMNRKSLKEYFSKKIPFIGAPKVESDFEYPDYPNIEGSWADQDGEEKYAWYHKPTKLWVYFLPNYDKRQIISLGLKTNATVFRKEDIENFTAFLKASSFNGIKGYAHDNFLEFQCKTIN